MKLNKFMHLTKVDVAKKLIYGTFTAEVVDKSGEIADYESTKAALKDWSAEIEKASGGKSLGNIRKMHGKEAVGKVTEITYDDANKMVHGCVEANQQTIDEADRGILNGFSIGGSYAKKWADTVHKGKTRFTPIIAEISVVDNPCVPDAVFSFIKDAQFTVVKADGTEELRKFAPKELEHELELAQVWKAHDGSTHATKTEAVAANAAILAKQSMSEVDKALDAVDKKEPAKDDKLEKALHHVAALAHVVNNLSTLAKDHEADKGEGHPVTAKLKKHVRGLSDTLHTMAGDEADNMNEEHEAGKAYKAAIEAGKALEKFADTSGDDLAKVTAERDALAKELESIPAKITAKFEAMTKRIKELEAMPVADKAILTTIVKGGNDDTQHEPDQRFVPSTGLSPGDRFRLMNR